MNILPSPGLPPSLAGSRPQAGRTQHGIAIPELLVGLFVLGTLTIAIASLAALGTRSSARNEYTVTAQALVKEQVEQIIDLPYADVGCRNADTSDPTQVEGELDCTPTTHVRNNVSFISTITVIAIDDPLDNPDPNLEPGEPDRDYKQVTVNITTANQGTLAVTAQEVTTLVAPNCNCPLPAHATNPLGLPEAQAAGGSGAEGQDCVDNNECATAAGIICNPPATNTCPDGSPRPPGGCPCENSLDCTGNESCNPSTNTCNPPPNCNPGTFCPNGQVCPQNGTCDPPPCVLGDPDCPITDADCPNGQIVVGGVCADPLPCASVNNCPADFSCVNGTCRPEEPPEKCECLVAQGIVVDNSRVAHLLNTQPTGGRVAAATDSGQECIPSCTDNAGCGDGFCCQGGMCGACGCPPGDPTCTEPPICPTLPIGVDCLTEPPRIGECLLAADGSGSQTVTTWEEGSPVSSLAQQCGASIQGRQFCQPVIRVEDCSLPNPPRNPWCDLDDDGLLDCGDPDAVPPKNLDPNHPNCEDSATCTCAQVFGNEPNGEEVRTSCCWEMDTGEGVEGVCRSDVQLDENGEVIVDENGDPVPPPCTTETGAEGICVEEDVANTTCNRFLCSARNLPQPTNMPCTPGSINECPGGKVCPNGGFCGQTCNIDSNCLGNTTCQPDGYCG